MTPISHLAIPGHAWVEIDLGAIAANARAYAARTGCPLLPMVKADAYGLGMMPVVGALEGTGPWGYGVATIREGEALRAAGITRPVLVLTPFTPFELEAYLRSDLRPTIADVEGLGAWAVTGKPFHLEVDTGMARTGLAWDEPVSPQVQETLQGALEGGAWEGVFTHLHSAEREDGSADVQRSRFATWLETVGARPSLVHVANSAGGLAGVGPEETLARPGYWLYGGEVRGERGRSVARLRAPVVAVRRVRCGETVSYGATWTASRETTIATLGAGYADGVPRALSNRGEIELGDRTVPIVGTVTMDYVMVDVGDTFVRPGDVATIWGGRVSLDHQARLAGTVGYELLTGMGPRVVRRYSSGER